MESDSGVCLQSRFLYQLHFSPVPHSDRLISPHPSEPLGEKDKPHGNALPPVSILDKDTFIGPRKKQNPKKQKTQLFNFVSTAL